MTPHGRRLTDASPETPPPDPASQTLPAKPRPSPFSGFLPTSLPRSRHSRVHRLPFRPPVAVKTLIALHAHRQANSHSRSPTTASHLHPT